MNIIIGGDLCPINSNETFFSSPGINKIFTNYHGYFKNADLSILNLEAPLTFSINRALKSGANIKAHPDCIQGIKDLGVNVLSAANNHIGDFSEEGILDTINICNESDIPIIGVGSNIEDASNPFLFKKGNIQIGILSYADTEFGMATENSAGANPFDIISAIKQIEKLKNKVNYIIMLLHEGKEYYRYPSPDLQKTCRFLVERGADLIVCQHSHVIGAWEKYLNGDIFYGQGNFIFDYGNRRFDDWLYGFLIQLSINDNKKEIKLIPFKQNFPGIKPLTEEELKSFDNSMQMLKNNVVSNEFITQNWIRFCKKHSSTYLSILKGHNRYIRYIFAKFGLYKYIYNNEKLLTLLNITRSRVHRELLITLLEHKTDKK